MERTRTTVYHPKGNVQVERYNRTLEAMLAKVVHCNSQIHTLHTLPSDIWLFPNVASGRHVGTTSIRTSIEEGKVVKIPLFLWKRHISTSMRPIPLLVVT